TSLTVFDVAGRQVETLYSGIPKAGIHQIHWEATDQPSGIYFVRLHTENRAKSVKITIIR
ncbi:MAG: T9SS type A sorting domain-containing protein, partial [Candidatus Electryoneaceae bacterium]|nr:T9SS type A sorting domain-containing protein [Candidatus Electryoneaceae bacterium]